MADLIIKRNWVSSDSVKKRGDRNLKMCTLWWGSVRWISQDPGKSFYDNQKEVHILCKSGSDHCLCDTQMHNNWLVPPLLWNQERNVSRRGEKGVFLSSSPSRPRSAIYDSASFEQASDCSGRKNVTTGRGSINKEVSIHTFSLATTWGQ